MHSCESNTALRMGTQQPNCRARALFSANILKRESPPETSAEFARQLRARRPSLPPSPRSPLPGVADRRIPNPGHARRASILRSPFLPALPPPLPPPFFSPADAARLRREVQSISLPSHPSPSPTADNGGERKIKQKTVKIPFSGRQSREDSPPLVLPGV